MIKILFRNCCPYDEPVNLENGDIIASRIGAYNFIECSTKTNECVIEVLE